MASYFIKIDAEIFKQMSIYPNQNPNSFDFTGTCNTWISHFCYTLTKAKQKQLNLAIPKLRPMDK